MSDSDAMHRDTRDSDAASQMSDVSNKEPMEPLFDVEEVHVLDTKEGRKRKSVAACKWPYLLKYII